jgi:hypothetical protein
MGYMVYKLRRLGRVVVMEQKNEWKNEIIGWNEHCNQFFPTLIILSKKDLDFGKFAKFHVC